MERRYQSSTADNAMTEIALALAMGFFSIMVLTMVSMGAGKVDSAPLVVAAALQAPADTAQPQSTILSSEQDQLVIFHNGKYFNKDMQPINLADLDFSNRIILGLSPDLEMRSAIDVRSQFKTENLVISTLNEEWVSALKRTAQ